VNEDRRVIVNVATGRYLRGQQRLVQAFPGFKRVWADQLPPGCPPHEQVPYAFKAFALKQVASSGHYDLLLWLDASIVPGPASLDLIWERLEKKGYWISKNGYRNSEWTARSALQYLGVTEEENDQIEHVVATAFGLNLKMEIGRQFLEEYYRLANTEAFCGPWRGGIGVQHRHDQTAASVIAHKLGMELTNPPEWFAYKGGEMEKTVLVAAGAY
jgi:hypothetical protein